MRIGLYNILKLRGMPKTWPLCNGAKSNLGDSVLGEVEKNRFTALPGKGEHSRLMPLKLRVPKGRFS